MCTSRTNIINKNQEMFNEDCIPIKFVKFCKAGQVNDFFFN